VQPTCTIIVFECDLPVQLTPSPVYPGRHVQMKLPGTLVQVPAALHPPLFLAHSSISIRHHRSRRYAWKSCIELRQLQCTLNVFNFTAASANKCYRYRLLKQGIAAEYSYHVETVKADIALPGGGAHLRATGRYLPYGITQCYLPPYTRERAPSNPSHTVWYLIYLPQRDGMLS